MTTSAIIKARPSAYAFINPKAVTRKPGFNPRYDFGDTAELAKSIRYQATEIKVPGGLLNPIRVEKVGDGFGLIDGDRRLTAVELLLAMHAEGKPDGYDFPEGIPAMIVTAGQSEIQSLIQTFEAGSNKPFTPLEEAGAYKRMRDSGMTIEAICGAVQRAHVHVVKTLALLEADPSLQAAVVSGEVGGTIAKEIAVAARGDKALQAELTAEAKAAGPKDKKALAKVKAKIQNARVAKAASKGKVLKVKPMAADQLAALGAKIAKHLEVQMRAAKIDADATGKKLELMAAADETAVVLFTFGVLQGLKAAAGVKDINLEL